MNHYPRIQLKNKISDLLFKYKHGNDIHAHKKTEKIMNYTNLFLTRRKD